MDWKLFAQLVGAFTTAAIGWWIVHYFSSQRDLRNKRRDLRLQFLLEAYRRLESVCDRQKRTEEETQRFEAAIADIQLLGTLEQVNATIKFAKAQSSSGEASLTEVLHLLRLDLRDEMGLPSDVQEIKTFRFIRENADVKE